jgi:hypothetical protein
MAAAEGQASLRFQPETWHGVVLETLKRNDVRLVPYVPDRVLTTLIKNLRPSRRAAVSPTAPGPQMKRILSGWSINRY